MKRAKFTKKISNFEKILYFGFINNTHLYNLEKKFYAGYPSCRNSPHLSFYPASRNTRMCLRWLGSANRIRITIRISKQQYGFIPGKRTTDAMFGLGMLMEKYREGQREIHCVFVDLEKAYDRVMTTTTIIRGPTGKHRREINY